MHFLEDWVASKVAVHEDCDLVNMFLSSQSQRRFGLSHQISRCTFQWNEIEFTRFTLSLGQICLGPSMKVSYKQICILLRHFHSESDSVFRSAPVCLVVSLVVSSLSSCSRCIQDSFMMSGACLESSSMSKYRSVWSVPTPNPRSNNRIHFTSESSNPSVPTSFAVHLGLRS